MFFVIKKLEQTIFDFSQNSVTVVWLYAIYKNGNSKDCKFIK